MKHSGDFLRFIDAFLVLFERIIDRSETLETLSETAKKIPEKIFSGGTLLPLLESVLKVTRDHVEDFRVEVIRATEEGTCGDIAKGDGLAS